MTMCSSLPSSLQTCVYIAIQVVVSYIKVSLVVLLHTQAADRDSALILVGVAIQLGSMFGAVLFFLLVIFTDIFQS